MSEQWPPPITISDFRLLGDLKGIVDLDAERRGHPGEDLAIPEWLIADTRAWVVVPVLQVGFNVVDDFAQSHRGEAGFGSTGKH